MLPTLRMRLAVLYSGVFFASGTVLLGFVYGLFWSGGSTRTVPVPGGAYFVTMALGLAGSLLVILASLPLLRRLTAPDGVRFE